jgi:hypothetical protein
MPPVADALGRDERGEAGLEPKLERGRVDGLAREQLLVGGLERVRRAEVELELREPVLGMQLADLQAVGGEILEQLGGERVDLQQRVRAVARPLVRRRELVVAPLADEELELVAGLDLEAGVGHTLHLCLERGALVIGPRRAVVPELAPGRPREARLAGERLGALQHRQQPDVSRGVGQALVRERDRVVRVHDREQRRDADAARRDVLDAVDRHRARAWDAVVVGPDDRQPGDPGLGKLLGKRGRGTTHAPVMPSARAGHRPG